MQNKRVDVNLKPDRAFDPETETIEPIGPYSFIQKISGNRYTQDSVRLVDFVLEGECKGSKVIDLGTGAGVMPLLIAAKTRAMEITGVEVVDEYAALAKRNVLLNGLSTSIKIASCDFRDLPANHPEGSFDIVISNPPYIKAGAGRQSPDPVRWIGRSEVMGGLRDLLTASRHLAGRDGRMFFVFPVARMDEMLGEMEALDVKPLRIVRCYAANERGYAAMRAKIFFIEAGTRAAL